MAEWVSFQELKQRVSIEDILRHYGLLENLKQRKDELVGLCPFHKETKGSFHASLAKNAFQCFGCKRKGNILDFVAAKEDVSIREAAVLIQVWFQVGSQGPQKTPAGPLEPAARVSVPTDDNGDGNKPLTFTLRNLNPKHPYLKERGLEKGTVEHFGLGYCSRGLMKERIAIPIHNERGELVAYAGRYAGEKPEEEEKYLVPSGFAKSQVLFNLHQAREFATDQGLILVEGFFDVFNLWQSGFTQVVGLMGSWLSEEQKELLVATLGADGKVTLLLDGDDAGRACEVQCVEELAPCLYVKVVRLPEPFQQPDNLTETEIHQLLAG